MTWDPDRPDPLEDRPAHECEDGWVRVKEPYARHMALSKLGEGATDEHPAFAQLYASALNSCYPCRVCRPVQFYRWAGRHYERDHDVSSCAECIESRGARRRGQRVAAMVAGDAQTERARRDLDA